MHKNAVKNILLEKDALLQHKNFVAYKQTETEPKDSNFLFEVENLSVHQRKKRIFCFKGLKCCITMETKKNDEILNLIGYDFKIQ